RRHLQSRVPVPLLRGTAASGVGLRDGLRASMGAPGVDRAAAGQRARARARADDSVQEAGRDQSETRDSTVRAPDVCRLVPEKGAGGRFWKKAKENTPPLS